MTICFKKMREKATIPSFGHGDDSNYGVDFYTCLDKVIVLSPGQSAIVPTGIAWQPLDIPYNHKVGMVIQSRSGIAFKDGIESSNAGVIDQSYRGEIMLRVYNWGSRDFTIENGMRIAQGIIGTVPKYTVIEVAEIDDTERGDKGFGSSGRM